MSSKIVSRIYWSGFGLTYPYYTYQIYNMDIMAELRRDCLPITSTMTLWLGVIPSLIWPATLPLDFLGKINNKKN